ncbi:MAG: transporter substrate-binding domain-containing protein, partial [Chlamydiia bacterium]|nr:transporter substrate-binding domain-containing protein [Chlamydiia bacterium]
MKKFIFRLFVVLSLFAVSLFAEEKNPNPLVMGTASGYAPFVSLNEKGEYEGFDIDIANALAKKLNRPLEIKDYGTMPSLMLALKQKKVDAIIWAISMTEKRKASLEMIHYQGEKEETIPLVFWGETPE